MMDQFEQKNSDKSHTASSSVFASILKHFMDRKILHFTDTYVFWFSFPCFVYFIKLFDFLHSFTYLFVSFFLLFVYFTSLSTKMLHARHLGSCHTG